MVLIINTYNAYEGSIYKSITKLIIFYLLLFSSKLAITIVINNEIYFL